MQKVLILVKELYPSVLNLFSLLGITIMQFAIKFYQVLILIVWNRVKPLLLIHYL